jgi:hypothetical protein
VKSAPPPQRKQAGGFHVCCLAADTFGPPNLVTDGELGPEFGNTKQLCNQNLNLRLVTGCQPCFRDVQSLPTQVLWRLPKRAEQMYPVATVVERGVG